MNRSKWKGVYIEKEFLNNFIKESIKNTKIIVDESEHEQDVDVKLFNYKGNLRNSTIIDSFIGYEFNVFNGIKYNSVVINSNMIGFKFGDFSLVNNSNKYTGRLNMLIRKYHRALRKVTKKRERRERRMQKALEKDD